MTALREFTSIARPGSGSYPGPPAGQGGPQAAHAVSPISAHRLHRRIVYGFAPAGVAAVITLVRTDRAATALVMFLAIVAVNSVLGVYRHPLHLIALARFLVAFVVPAAGTLLGVLAAHVTDLPVAAGTATAAFLGAVVISLAAAWLDDRFMADRPIRIAVIGSGPFTGRLTAEMAENQIRSYKVVGYLAEERDDEPRTEWLGPVPDIRSVVTGRGIDLLVVSPQTQRLQAFEFAAKACLDLPVRMIEATALYEDVLGHVPIGTINSAWFQFIMHPRYSPTSPLSKRALDLVVSSILIVLAAPLMALCAIAVKLADGGPVLFRQPRVGEEGREFSMMKFRTLVPDADERFANGASERDLITPVGRLLRKGHLNELPQLLQVALGDISLVGPRPEPPAVVRSLSGLVPHYERRALVKPGLTGWAQVRCGYAGTHAGTAWKTCHDLYYIKHRSARFDLLILMQTLHALIENEEEEHLPAPDFIIGEHAELAPR